MSPCHFLAAITCYGNAQSSNELACLASIVAQGRTGTAWLIQNFYAQWTSSWATWLCCLFVLFPCASASMSGLLPVPTYALTLHSTWLFCLVAFVLLVLLLQYTGTQVGSLPMNAACLPFGMAVYARAHGWHPCFRISAARRSFLRCASISTLGVYAYLLPFGVVHLLTRMAGTPVLGYHVVVSSCSLLASAAWS